MLMRGVNVGGVKVPMAELRALLAELGLADARTVLQTGNVTFEADLPPDELKTTLERAVGQRFDYSALVFILARDLLATAVADYPFEADEAMHRYIVVCADNATAHELIDAADPDPSVESVAGGEQIVYWNVERGRTLKTPFAKLLASARFAPHTTNRNINTLERLLRA